MSNKLIEYYLNNIFFLYLMYASMRIFVFYLTIGYKNYAFIWVLTVTILSKGIMFQLRKVIDNHWIFYFPILLLIYLILKQQRSVEKDKSPEEGKIINKKIVFVICELLIIFLLMFWWSKSLNKDFF